MNAESIRDLINKIPVGLIIFFYAGYLGFGYYQFKTSSESPFVSKQKNFKDEQENNKKMNLKLKEVQEFIKHIDEKKIELRTISKELQDVQGSLPEVLDVPKFMKTVITEAERVGVKILSLSPSGSEKKEYYIEQNFILNFKSVYVQFISFVERLSNVNDIVRIDRFDIKANSSPRDKYVELAGTVELKTYRYLRSKADTLGADDVSNKVGPR